MSFGDYVKRVKQEKRLTYLQIEKNSDGEITDSYVSKIVKGEVKNPGPEKLSGLARGLKVPLDEVMREFRGDPPPEAWTAREIIKAIETVVGSPELTEILKLLLPRSPRDLDKVLKYLRRK